VADARIVPTSEAELADAPPGSSSGKIVRHRGHHWRQTFPGLFEPLHPLARLAAEDATRPSVVCWGFHSTLADGDGNRANASKPMHLLADLASFGPESLSSNRRYELRRSRRSVEFVHVLDIEAIEPEAYAVFRSAQDRTQNPWRKVSSPFDLADQLGWYVRRPSAVLLAGMTGGKLGGWIAGYAIGATAYIDIVDLATEALSSHISIGLHFEFLDVCRRSGGIREVAHSPHNPRNPTLGAFKERVGFPVVHVPSRFEMAPVARSLLRRRRPFLYYRLSGQATGPVQAAIEGRPSAPPGRS
jgi:hypothetical protein